MRLDMESGDMETALVDPANAERTSLLPFDDDPLSGGRWSCWLPEGRAVPPEAEEDCCCMCVMARDVADVVRETTLRAEDPTMARKEGLLLS